MKQSDYTGTPYMLSSPNGDKERKNERPNV